jgi:hypothetical protein
MNTIKTILKGESGRTETSDERFFGVIPYLPTPIDQAGLVKTTVLLEASAATQLRARCTPSPCSAQLVSLPISIDHRRSPLVCIEEFGPN